MRKPVGRGDVARGQACQARCVEVEHLSVRGYLLAVFINQKDELGVRVRAQTHDNSLELLVLLFIHYDRSRHLLLLYSYRRKGSRAGASAPTQSLNKRLASKSETPILL